METQLHSQQRTPIDTAAFTIPLGGFGAMSNLALRSLDPVFWGDYSCLVAVAFTEVCCSTRSTQYSKGHPAGRALPTSRLRLSRNPWPLWSEWSSSRPVLLTRVISHPICDIVRPKESAMLNWLLRLWHRFGTWLQQRPAARVHPASASQQYHPSNLHARHR